MCHTNFALRCVCQMPFIVFSKMYLAAFVTSGASFDCRDCSTQFFAQNNRCEATLAAYFIQNLLLAMPNEKENPKSKWTHKGITTRLSWAQQRTTNERNNNNKYANVQRARAIFIIYRTHLVPYRIAFDCLRTHGKYSSAICAPSSGIWPKKIMNNLRVRPHSRILESKTHKTFRWHRFVTRQNAIHNIHNTQLINK